MQEVLGMLGPNGVGKSTIFHYKWSQRPVMEKLLLMALIVQIFQFTKELLNLRRVCSVRRYSGFNIV